MQSIRTFCKFDSHPIAPRIDDGPISYILSSGSFFLRIWIIICWRYERWEEKGPADSIWTSKKKKTNWKIEKNKIGTATHSSNVHSLSLSARQCPSIDVSSLSLFLYTELHSAHFVRLAEVYWIKLESHTRPNDHTHTHERRLSHTREATDRRRRKQHTDDLLKERTKY